MKNIQNRNLACTSAGRRWGGGGGSYGVQHIKCHCERLSISVCPLHNKRVAVVGKIVTGEILLRFSIDIVTLC